MTGVPDARAAAVAPWPPGGSARPYTRWWWLNGPFRDDDVARQLAWLAGHGFGGVEIAWLHPAWSGEFHVDRPEWLGAEWSRITAHAKAVADRLGLGCDFTFGSVWPFGGTCVPEEFASKTFDGPSEQRLRVTWEEPARGRVLDHLDAAALDHYVARLAPAFASVLRGSRSALFCDSFEVDAERLWHPRLWDEFAARFGYSLREFTDRLESDPGARYDHLTVIGDAVVREFYAPFAAHCRALGAVSRVQCHGAPADLISAYLTADVPESEAVLFPPAFSRIAASAAAIAGRTVVSCETFTCIYGFPRGRDLVNAVRAWKKERISDLKLVADAVLANGVNAIVWHGTPFNPPGGENEFYASVHVGEDSPLVPHLRPFNAYLEAVCGAMRRGVTLSRLAVYLPNEDGILAGPIPEDERVPGAANRWEMREARVPASSEGFAPLWVSGPALAGASVRDGALAVGAMRADALLVDAEWLDSGALGALDRLAGGGLPIAIVRRPRQPGRVPDPAWEARVDALLSRPCVVRDPAALGVVPFLEGEDAPWFWARDCGDEILVFVAHPAARGVRYPMAVGEAETKAGPVRRRVRVRAFAKSFDVELDFDSCGSILLRVAPEGVRRLPLPEWSSPDRERHEV